MGGRIPREARYFQLGWRLDAQAPPARTVNEKFAGADEAVPPGSTRISAIDPKTGNSLWSDIRKTDNAKAAAHMLDGRREAFDQKQK
jgi:hypothetical protein